MKHAACLYWPNSNITLGDVCVEYIKLGVRTHQMYLLINYVHNFICDIIHQIGVCVDFINFKGTLLFFFRRLLLVHIHLVVVRVCCCRCCQYVVIVVAAIHFNII